ncbi:TetR/AcrR family transcriptional regulator [Chitiniphilus purpureus]|uniref:TetR/AcrR family transcriptional regulator n=1 Tax=Chitiniphilus purpureus TaxID=2981137 RepID=A0ABY6DLS7_9NEIS|nr:TetR/AcrR family transcriptional regulator [Chitiniphilus sp. CD1]UXY15315.1 TetR/AcrR family transcriptional regulator [Chitiniphilus sp. CD1]
MTTPRSRRTRGRPAAALDQDVRGQLLATALALFAEQGIAATSMAQIAARTGVTPAMVHYYFSNRDQLLDAVVQERLSPLVEQVWTPDPAEADALDIRVQGVVRRLAAQVARNPWLPSLWIGEILNESGLLRARMLAHLPLAQLQQLIGTAAAAQARGALHPDIVPQLLPVTLLGLTMLPLAMLGLIRQLPGLAAPDADAIVRHACAVLTHGLRSPP